VDSDELEERRMIEGLMVIPHFVSDDEEQFVVSQLDAVSESGESAWVRDGNSRPAQHFGAHYDYTARTLQKAAEIPTWLLPFCYRVYHCKAFDAVPKATLN
jgi:hypothetical protein